MSDVVQLPVRSTNEPHAASALYLNRIHAGAAYFVKTSFGSTYRVRLDIEAEAHKTNSGKAHLLVSKEPSSEEYHQEAGAIIRVGEPWEISPGHFTNPITSIEPAPLR